MRILIPVDGSRFASAAVAFVASRRTLLGSPPEIDVLNVQLAIPPRVTRLIGREVVESYHEAEAKAALKPALAILRRSGAEPSATYVVGHPAEEIARAAECYSVDLIAMGSHGHAALKGLLLGSPWRSRHRPAQSPPRWSGSSITAAAPRSTATLPFPPRPAGT
jgi:nucleotide-binding universal stress UspA family protein